MTGSKLLGIEPSQAIDFFGDTLVYDAKAVDAACEAIKKKIDKLENALAQANETANMYENFYNEEFERVRVLEQTLDNSRKQIIEKTKEISRNAKDKLYRGELRT